MPADVRRVVDAVQDPDDDGAGEVGDPFADGLVEQAFEQVDDDQRLRNRAGATATRVPGAVPVAVSVPAPIYPWS